MSSDNQSLCVITSCYPRTKGDWAGVFIKTLTTAISSSHDISVVAPDDFSPVEDDDKITRFSYAPKSMQKLAYGDGILDNLKQNPLRILLIPPFLLAGLAASAKVSKRATLIHSHWIVPSGLFGALISRATGKPHMLTVHSGGIHALRRLPLGRRLIRFIIKNSTHVVAVSRYTRELILDSLPIMKRSDAEKKLSVIPMPPTIQTSGDSKEIIRERWGITEKNIVLFVGRLVTVKGIDTLVQAMASFKQSDAIAIIAGEGMERESLEKMASGISSPVRFVGAVDAKQKGELFKIADIFVLPSKHLESGRQEGLPVSLLEALSMGVPIVASDVGGIREVLKDGVNGLIVPPGEVSFLADSISSLFKDRALRSTLKMGAQDTGKDFLPEIICERYLKIVSNL